MNRTPQVTVLIPVYNQEKYVAEAVESILAQTFTDFELLVIDDGSSDTSRDIIRSYQDPRLRLISNEKNLGVAKTHNKGLALARGAYFAVLDHDDYAYTDRLAKEVHFLDEHKDYAIVGSWITTVNDEGQVSNKVIRRPITPEETHARLLFRCALQHPTIMGRTDVLRAYGYREQFAGSDDFDLFVRLAGHYKLASLPEVLVRRRYYSGQFSRTPEAREKQEYKQIFGAQLAALGVPFTDEDLEGHLKLRRASGFTPDHEYLTWASSWLWKLKQANESAHQYPEPAFTRVLEERWFKTCKRASADLGWQAWRRFWQSPLRAGIWQIALRKIPWPAAGSEFRGYSQASASN